VTTAHKQTEEVGGFETPPSSKWWALNYALAVLVGAFLLFQVQPLISKSILPWFGGGPAIWTTCMVFFQVVLFAGYAYAHLLTRWASPAAQVAVHVALVAAAIWFLPVTPDESWKPQDSLHPAGRIMLLLAGCMGLPYFVLSSTGPLMQAWFRRTYPDRSPYRLYALSNVGSLAALVSYPFVFEPALDIPRQAAFWSAGFGVFAVLCALAALAIWRGRRRGVAQAGAGTAGEPIARVSNEPPEAPSLLRSLVWLALAAFASMMLLATTNHVCQDVAVIPFLWVVPLSVYLITFIIAFDRPGWYRRRWFGIAAMVALFIVANVGRLTEVSMESGAILDLYQQFLIYFSMLFLVCMIAHGELARLRPHPAYLTTFYLMIAAGGALGGMLVSIVAPLVFATYLEWRIGIVLSFVLATVVALASSHPAPQRQTAWRIGIAILFLVGLIVFEPLHPQVEKRIHVSRNFYGVLTVADVTEHKGIPASRELRNGVTVHGAELLPLEAAPISYYSPDSGIAMAFRYLASSGSKRIGAVGLGTGTLAAFVRPGDVIRFYEINPAVEYVARTYFTFVPQCKGTCEIQLGDARLSLEREASQNFDMIVLDAFSSDAIPTHLLTKEAFEIYLRHLKPHGIIALHVSNKYIKLERVAYGLARHFKFSTTLIGTQSDFKRIYFGSEWILLTDDQEFLKDKPKPPLTQATEQYPLWTDQWSNTLELLR